jgi:hypothetical protein
LKQSGSRSGIFSGASASTRILLLPALSLPLHCFKVIKGELFDLGGESADAVSTAKFTFECGVYDVGVLTWVGFGNDICVGWFAVDVCGDVAVGEAWYVNIKEGNDANHFFLCGEFYARLDSIEALVEVGSWIQALHSTAS